MSNLPNYYPDVNRFNLAGPPAFFLRQLWEYDPSLVIIPSRMGFYYRLAQRRKLQLPENVINDVMREQADTQMLARYGLVPVTTILATIRWDSPLFFADLNMKAPWRMGGADKYEKLLLEQEKKERLEQLGQRSEHLDYLAKDAWKFYNKKIGTRTHLWSPTTKTKVAKGAHAVIVPATQDRKSVV